MLPLGSGKSLYGIDENILHVEWIGAPTLEEAKQVVDCISSLSIKHSKIYLIVDISRSGIPSQEIRKCFASTAQVRAVAGVAAVVSDPIKRGLMQLITRAQELVSGATYEQRFFSDLDSAWSWIASQQPPRPLEPAKE